MKYLRIALLCLFVVFVMGCSKTEPDRISAIVNQTGPWSGNFEMKWDLTGISLKGKLLYDSKLPPKSVVITPHYDETALGQPDGYMLPFSLVDKKASYENTQKEFDLYSSMGTYKTPKTKLDINTAKAILNNLVFNVEYTDASGVKHISKITFTPK